MYNKITFAKYYPLFRICVENCYSLSHSSNKYVQSVTLLQYSSRCWDTAMNKKEETALMELIFELMMQYVGWQIMM
jgi:hypothetical protein